MVSPDEMVSPDRQEGGDLLRKHPTPLRSGLATVCRFDPFWDRLLARFPRVCGEGGD